MKIKNLLLNLIHLLYPRLCIGCTTQLVTSEEILCIDCYRQLPRTNHFLIPNNPAYDQLASKIPIQKATSFIYYNKEGIGQKIISAFKYRSHIAAGKWISGLMTREIMTSDFFTGIDLIIPIPLHKSKKKLRGFNQTEIIAQVISGITGIPVDSVSLYRSKGNPSQTKKTIYDRWINSTGIFRVKENSTLAGKNILLVDDVLTTGATLEAAAHALFGYKNVKISILTVAIA